MARSDLMRLLRRVYGVVQMSHKTGIPVDELWGMSQEQKRTRIPLSRRKLLQVGLGAMGAIAASTFRRDSVANAQLSALPPVLIVGAGIAGLTAAYRLRQAGIPVNVIEARNQVGGRIRTLQKVAGTSLVAELGGEFIDTDHTYLLSLAQELSLPIVDLFAPDQGLIPETYYLANQRISLDQLIQDFIPVAQQIESDLANIENFSDYTTPNTAATRLDSISLAQYLDGIPTSAIMRQLLRIAYTADFGLNAEEQSPLNLIYYIGTEPGTFEIFGDSDERFYIDGGNQQIPVRLAQLLGASIELGISLERITGLSDGRYQVSLRSGNQTFDRVYDRVILTIPFSVLRTIPLNVDLPATKRQAIDEVGYGTNSKLVTAYSQKIWRSPFTSRGNVFTDIGFQNSWETSNSRYSPGTVGLITNYTGGSQGVAIGAATAEAQAQQFRLQFDVIFPGSFAVAIPNSAVRAYWTGDPFSQGSYLCYRVGQFTRFYGVEGERVGNLFFAGEHTSLEYQGFMEGGCETGERVAIEILEDLGFGEIAQTLTVRMQKLRNSRTRRSRRPGRKRNRF